LRVVRPEGVAGLAGAGCPHAERFHVLKSRRGRGSGGVRGEALAKVFFAAGDPEAKGAKLCLKCTVGREGIIYDAAVLLNILFDNKQRKRPR
jgi:hypothetical protein